MSWIDTISKEQIEKIPLYVNRWKNIALSTSPTDEEKAKLAIEALYENASLEKPKKVVILESPGACLYAMLEIEYGYLKKNLNVTHPEAIKAAKRKYRLRQYLASLTRSIDNSERFKNKISFLIDGGGGNAGWDAHYQVWNYFNRDLELSGPEDEYEEERLNSLFRTEPNRLRMARIYSGIDSCLRRTLWDFVTQRKEIPVPRNHLLRNHISMIGQTDWLCCSEYYKDIIGERDFDKIAPLINVAKECSWLLPYDNVCFASAKPTVIHTDDQGRLHRYGGPAIEYSDGWAGWAVNGVTMPKKYANELPEKWKSEWLLKNKNAAQRRQIIKTIGYSKIMCDLGAEQIHVDGDMSLHRINNKVDVEGIFLLKVKCPSTGTNYALRVPPHAKTCEEARRALMHNSKGIYSFIKET